jgi:hypothetical protein
VITPDAFDAVLARTPVATVPEVLDRLNALGLAMDPTDGIACFNALYVRVTSAVLDADTKGTFASPQFVETLDVTFANLYFAGLAAWRAGEGVPGAWAPLFDAHDSRDIHPLQFALAGMNAHINRDLPVALCQTSTETGIALDRAGAAHADYEAVNPILAEVERVAKTDYFGPLAARLDRKFDGVDDVVATWGMREAREAAWIGAEVLSTLGPATPLGRDYVATADRVVGFAGRGLLVKTAV